MYYTLMQQMKKGLLQLDAWLTRTTEHAKARGYDPDVLITARLAPDQFAFARQVQIACDTAKLASTRLTGRDAPKHDDSEKTIAALQGRVHETIAWLDTLDAAAYEGASERVISQPRWEGKTMSGADYFVEHALPNFYFHLTTTYALLRHNGVDLGKRDFLGPLTMKQPS